MIDRYNESVILIHKNPKEGVHEKRGPIGGKEERNVGY